MYNHSTATEILAAVQTAMSNGNTTSITLTGHSLGKYLAEQKVAICNGCCCRRRYCIAGLCVPAATPSLYNHLQDDCIRPSSGMHSCLINDITPL